MSAVAETPATQVRRRRTKKVFSHLPTTRFFTALFAWMLPAVMIFASGVSYKIPFQIHPVVFLSLAICVWAYYVRGAMSIARTPIDIFFMLWLVIAVSSQIYATTALNRILIDNDWIEYSKQIFTSWIMYRAAFALAMVDTKTATNTLLRSILFFAALACLIGLFQWKGPLQQTALNFAKNFGTNPDQVDIGFEIESPRPVGMFSGPNYFAFINLICCAIVVGITLGTGKRMKEIHAFLAVLAMGLFFAGSFVAQSRIALVMLAIMIMIFLYLIGKMGKGRVLIFAVVSMILTGITLFAFKGDVEFDYLTSVFSQGIQNDDSYLLRRDAINAITQLAPDLAPLGAGGNRFSTLLMRTGDKFSPANGPDNAFLQGFLDHGIPGVLHILFLIWALYYGVRCLRPNGEAFIERLRFVSALVLVFFVLYSFSASRHQKPETGFYLWMIFGPLWAAVIIQQAHERALKRADRLRARELARAAQ